MTPAEKARAREIINKATPGEWRYENLNWVGTPLFAIYASKGPGDRGATIFDNIESDSNSYNNIEFITEAQAFFPKVLDHLDALEDALKEVQNGKIPAKTVPAMTAKEFERARELLTEATQGTWSWEEEPQLGKGIYTVYAGRDPMMHGYNLFGRMDTGDNAENNLNFITEMHALFPKALARINTLENVIEALQKPAPSPKSRPGTPPRP